jgi:hypothetical protein
VSAADLEGELLLDLDLQQPAGAIDIRNHDRLEAAIALWQRGVVTIDFYVSGASDVVGRVRRAYAVTSAPCGLFAA